MKKLLASLALICVAGYAFGQGQVNFVNTTATSVSTNNGTVGLTSTVVPSYYYGLFWAPSGTTDTNAFVFSGAYGTNQSVAGRFSGGAGSAAAPAISGQAIGSTVAVLVRGWSADLGRDWTAVNTWFTDANRTVGGLYGQSGIGTVVLGGGATPIPTPFGTLANQIQTGFTLSYVPAVIPEPSSFALAGLGLAALMIFRRRK